MKSIEVFCINTLLPEREREDILRRVPLEYLEKAQSAGNPVLARQELAVGWLLHRVLGFGQGDRLVRGPMGKPRVGGGRPYISIAHSGNWAVIAVGDCEVGVDLEVPGPVQWAAARKYFRPDELHSLQTMAPASQPAAFLRMWTRLEAGLKLRGTGFSGAAGSDAKSEHRNMLYWNGECEGFVLCCATWEPAEYTFREMSWHD